MFRDWVYRFIKDGARGNKRDVSFDVILLKVTRFKGISKNVHGDIQMKIIVGAQRARKRCKGQGWE